LDLAPCVWQVSDVDWFGSHALPGGSR